MALIVLIKNAVNLRGRYDRIARISFRGITYQTQVYEDCSDPDWDEEFVWPLASQLNPSEYIEIQVLNHNKIFSNRVVGLYRMVLQRLIQEQHLALTDSLLDNNNTVLKAQLSLELTYDLPSGTVPEWITGLHEEQDDQYAENGEEIFPPTARRQSRMSLPGWKKGQENGQLKIGSSISLNSLGAHKKKSFGNLSHQMAQDLNRSTEIGPNQLGVVAGPFGQMLQSRDTGGTMSRRGSVYSVASGGSGTGMFHQHPKVRIDQKDVIKEIDYQIQIRVIEARQLSGMQLDPVCTVTVGSQKKHTAVKEQTNTPFWDEFFVFDFKMPALVLFDKIINFQVFTGRNLISQGILIGAFKLDIGTVYAQQDHRFIRRWAVLTDPEETLGASGAGVKGYLKVDITVLGKGDPIKEPPSVKDNDDDIESNLLLPDGVPAERPKARIVVKIYKAEGLPKMNSGLMANVKKAFTGEVRDLADPYVEVCFAGHKARTTVKKHTYEPEWNEQVTFAELFPPLCRRIKVQLKDSDSVTDEVVGTHFIDLSQISNDGANGFMPTFGPCWVNLYGSTRDFSLFDEHNSLNEGLGEGVAYRGHLLVAVQAEMGESASDASIKQVEVDGTAPISDTAAGKEDNFQLFACIYEANMIERKAGEKNVQFEMTIGNFGNTIDGQFIRDDLKDEADGDDERFVHSLTPSFKPTSTDRQYYYIPFEDTKPCMHLKFPFQDHRRRLYLSNMLYKIYERLKDGVDDVHERVKMDLEDTYKCLKVVFKDLIKGCGNFINICENKISGPTVGRTKLDRERQKLCINEVRSIAQQSKVVLESIHDNTQIRDNLRSAMEFLKRIQTIVAEPQHSIPDIFIWMLSGGKRVAYTRVPAQHVVYSQVDWEKGRNSGKVQSVFLRLPGKRGDGPKGWAIQAKLDVLLWIGLHKHKKDYLKDAPKGYQTPKGMNKMMSPPPNQLVYTEKQKFMLRAHIYQARSLIGSDASGLSDAFARVIFGQMAADTRVIWETRSPTWDQTLIFKECVIWGDMNETANNPPTIVIEIFDKDIGGDSEFIGRALARPIVKLATEKYDKPNFPPALEWFEIQRGDEKAGELLAAFELLHVVDEGKCFLPKEEEPVNTQDGPIIPVPDGIRPVMKKHRIEVLFWGVREMKRVNLTTVDRPQVDIDCAGHVVTSTVIANAKKNPNFSSPIAFFDVELPENERYCPPLTVRVRDCRTFGRFTLVGTHVVNSLHRYLQSIEVPPEQDQKKGPDEEGEAEGLDPNAPPPNDGEAALENIAGSPDAEGVALETIQEGGEELDETGEGLDETQDDFEPVTDGEYEPETEDELDAGPDLIIRNPGAEKTSGQQTPLGSSKMTPLKKVISAAGSIRSGGKKDSKRGSIVSASNSKKSGRKSPTASLSPEEPHHVSFSPKNTGSRRPSRLQLPSMTGTPSHGILKTPVEGTPGSQKWAGPNDIHIDIEGNQTIALYDKTENAVDSPQIDSEKNMARLNDVHGTPVQRLRSQTSSIIDRVMGSRTPSRLGSRVPSRVESRAPSRLGSRAPSRAGTPGLSKMGSPSRKGSGDIEQEMDVDKTLEMAADALAEQQEEGEKEEAKEAEPGAEKKDAEAAKEPNAAAAAGAAGESKEGEEFGGKKGRKSVDASKKNRSNEEGTSRPQSPSADVTIVEIGDFGDDVEERKPKPPGDKGKGEEDDDDEDSLDWWSRYYETVKDGEREQEEEVAKEAQKDVAVSKKDKKGDKDQDLPKRKKKPNPKITRIKIYNNALENMAEFNGFNDWLFSFPLFRGKKTSEDEDDDHRIVGKFKGALKVWKFPLPKMFENEPPNGSFTKLPSNEPVNVLVRCYVIRASELHPTDVNGKADPYLVVTCGKQKNKDRENYIPKQLNPIFGRVFDFEAIIPMDNMLTVGVFDYDLVGSDDLIGETKIDIENRFYSRHRPICGLSEAYATFGFNKWRDPMKPSQILARLCKDEGLDGPTYTAPGKCKIENHIFSGAGSVVDEAGSSKPSDEPAALKALHNFHTIAKKGFHLVPEHVETRSLYNPEKPGIEQGKIEMWIDMFAMDMPSPGAPVDITPRKPASFELRVVIWNTEDVLMDEVNIVTGEACSDIYVKGWIEGMKDEKQQTDVHYRSLTGEGNFNWRFIFPFQYQKAEEKIVIKKKATFFSWDESEEKVPPRLTLQVWDADAFSADDFIGDCCLDMVRMPRGAKTAKTCNLDTMKTDKPISLLKLKHIKGWWPFAVNTDLEEIELAGKVEAELELLTQEEAEKAPAGLAREEPQPLDKPNRPDTSFTWFMNPFKSLRYMIWEQYKFCLLKFLVIGLLIALMGLFFYSMPGYTVKKIFNA
ncbi:otoferlin-like isoform X2 [Rhopilema esculentum]|uniref:otoferlin-like isoform X2 n=1 Tax=Rhopilema esculentum TaxID=499914 RepID=UPI0031D9723A